MEDNLQKYDSVIGSITTGSLDDVIEFFESRNFNKYVLSTCIVHALIPIKDRNN